MVRIGESSVPLGDVTYDLQGTKVGLEICEDELKIDDLDISFWIDCSADMMNIGVIEGSHHLENCINRTKTAMKNVAIPGPTYERKISRCSFFTTITTNALQR